MSRIIRLAAVLVVVGGAATGLVAYATAGPPNHANRLEATFTETVQVVINNRAAYGIFQVILTGSGTLDGFGAATEVVGVTADASVTPCGARSSSDASTRRIVTAGGTLTLRESDETCETPAGRIATGTYEVDGQFSTGVFAGATGSGTWTSLLVVGGPHPTTLSGKLKLANDES